MIITILAIIGGVSVLCFFSILAFVLFVKRDRWWLE